MFEVDCGPYGTNKVLKCDRCNEVIDLDRGIRLVDLNIQAEEHELVCDGV